MRSNMVESVLGPDMFASRYADVFQGTEEWQAISATSSETYDWDDWFHLCPQPAVFHQHGWKSMKAG